MRELARLAVVLLAVAVLNGCTREEVADIIDPGAHRVDRNLKKTREDFQNLANPDYEQHTSFKSKDKGPPIPDIAEILAAPRPPKIGETQLVSLAVTDDVPLKDVLIELARLADVDIEIDAGIQGGVAFRAKERPFNEVIERIADLAGLRYSMKNSVLRVERDTPFVQIYHTDFLNIDRATSSSVSISTNVLSSAGGAGGSSGGSGLNTGSNASISSKTEGDFWKQFEAGVKQILDFQPTSRLSGGGASAAAGGAAPEGAVVGAGGSFMILNRQAATLTVSATERQHRLLQEFLRKVESNASAQVLIEAKVVEVKLNEKYQRGINWSQLGGTSINFRNRFGSVDDVANAATFAFTRNNVTGLDIDLDLAVQLTETFGTTRTLSSPRLHAINNQQAVLTFAENQVYFQLKVQRDQTSTGSANSTLLTVNSEIKTVPIGIILTLQPSINLDTNEVTLNVRPTLSRVTGFVTDPAVAFLLTQVTTQQNIESRVPIVEVRELDSILKLKSGQVMVIGGLMEDKSLNTERGIPGASRVPILGTLFKADDNADNTNELVIFIRATIVDSRGNAQDADKILYENYTRDPRPLSF